MRDHPFLKSVLAALMHFPQPEVHDAAQKAIGGGASLFQLFLTLMEAAFGATDIPSLIAKILALIPKQPAPAATVEHG